MQETSQKRKVIESLISKTRLYLGIIAVLLITICIYEKRLVIPSIVMYGILVGYSVQIDRKRKGQISEQIQELIVDTDSVVKSTLIASPFPLAIVETSGKVIWRSANFNDEFINVDIGSYLDQIIKEIKQEEKEEQFLKKMQIGTRTYEVIGQYTEYKSGRSRKKLKERAMALYFTDITSYEELQKAYQDGKTCVGVVLIDNYEETIARLEQETKTELVAKIEKEIYNWATMTGGLIVKTERDTFVYVFEQKYLKDLVNTKFDILDKIKEVDPEDKVQLSLSIAISNEGQLEYEKYKSAISSVELALGRGGDQAVVKENDKYTFFGGRTKEVEKRTKVKARMIASGLDELMRNSSKVIVMGHTNTDIDSIASGLGIYRFAKTIEKECYIVNDTKNLSIEGYIEELKKDDEYKDVLIDKQEALDLADENSLLVIVDTHKRNYVEAPELLEAIPKKVIIDHHRKSTDYIENSVLMFHETYASSAAELVIEILQYADTPVELKEIEAEGLYAGIMVDTKNFTFKTGVRTFEAAAYLRKCGVDIIKVKKWFQSDLERYNIIADIVKTAEIVNDTIGIAIYEEKDKNAGLICAKAADELLTISDITASFVLGNTGDKINISGRSIGDINVQIILEKLGGGGHITLAGAQLEGVTLEEAKQELIIRINEYFTEIG